LLVPEVAGENHRGHPASSELALDQVAVTEGVSEGGVDAGHGACRWEATEQCVSGGGYWLWATGYGL
jgi:hypothetical protein